MSCDGVPGGRGECARHVEAGYAGYLGDVIECDCLGEMAFDEPEGFVDGIHDLPLIYYNGGLWRSLDWVRYVTNQR